MCARLVLQKHKTQIGAKTKQVAMLSFRLKTNSFIYFQTVATAGQPSPSKQLLARGKFPHSWALDAIGTISLNGGFLFIYLFFKLFLPSCIVRQSKQNKKYFFCKFLFLYQYINPWNFFTMLAVMLVAVREHSNRLYHF